MRWYSLSRRSTSSDQKAPPLAGELSVSDSEQTEGEHSRHLAALSRSPFVTAHAATLSPHAGTAFGWRCHQPALKGEVDMSVSEWTEGL